MYIDFRVTYNKATATALMMEAKALGYDGIAFTTIIHKVGPNTFKTHRKEQDRVCQANFASSTAPRKAPAIKLQNDLAAYCLTTPPESVRDMLQISRLHVAVTGTNDSASVHAYLRNAHGVGPEMYDIVSMDIADEKSWHHTLSQGTIDMISIDLYDSRMPFTIRRAQLGLAARHNIYIEVCLDRALLDPSSCRHLFRNLPYITRYLPPSRLILSSGASTPLGLRSPADLIPLLQMLGFTNVEEARRIMAQNSKELLSRAAARRTGGPFYALPTDETQEETMVDR